MTDSGSALRTFMQYMIAFCSRPEAASDIISSKFVRPIVPEKRGQFRSRQIQTEAVVGGIFGGLSQ